MWIPYNIYCNVLKFAFYTGPLFFGQCEDKIVLGLQIWLLLILPFLRFFTVGKYDLKYSLKMIA